MSISAFAFIRFMYAACVLFMSVDVVFRSRSRLVHVNVICDVGMFIVIVTVQITNKVQRTKCKMKARRLWHGA